VADNHDRGANGVRVKLPDGRTLSVRAAWDTSFVERIHGTTHERPLAIVAIA
jgi:hypothetical protein